jgi:hypothetical protein
MISKTTSKKNVNEIMFVACTETKSHL